MVGMLVSFCLRENTSAQVAALSPLHTKTHTGQGGRVKSAKSAADYSHVRALRDRETAGVTDLLAPWRGPPSSLSQRWLMYSPHDKWWLVCTPTAAHLHYNY